MKIAFSTSGNSKDDDVDPRFGRCNNFVIYDEDSDSYETIQNEGVMSRGGAGIRAAQTLIDKGVKVVMTGNVGPNAFRTMSAAGIDIHIGVSGKIEDALAKYKSGELASKVDSPNVDTHHGM